MPRPRTGQTTSTDFAVGGFGPRDRIDGFVARLTVTAYAHTVQFGATSYHAAEGAGSATVTVTRVGACAGPATVNYATANNSATAGSDYGTSAGTLSFAAGEMSKTLSVTILNDTSSEGVESFLLAPRAIRRHGDRLSFKRWLAGGQTIGKSRRQPITVSGAGRYVAVYGRP